MQVLFDAFEEASVTTGDDVDLAYAMDNASCHRRAQEANIPSNHPVQFLPANSLFFQYSGEHRSC